jgi:hypothetical protein
MMNDKRKDSENGAFFDFEYPRLWLYNIIVQKLKHIISRRFVFFSESNQESRYEIIFVLLIIVVSEYFGVIDIQDSLFFMHDVEHLACGYFFIVEKIFEVLLEDDVVDEVLVMDAHDFL